MSVSKLSVAALLVLSQSQVQAEDFSDTRQLRSVPTRGAFLSAGGVRRNRLTVWNTVPLDGGISLEESRWLLPSHTLSAQRFSFLDLPSSADAGRWELLSSETSFISNEHSQLGPKLECESERYEVFEGPVKFKVVPGADEAPSEIGVYRARGRSKTQLLSSCALSGRDGGVSLVMLLAPKEGVINMSFNDDMWTGGAVWRLPSN